MKRETDIKGLVVYLHFKGLSMLRRTCSRIKDCDLLILPPLDNSKIVRICQAEYRDLPDGAKRICRLDYKDLPTGANRICRLDWIIFARNRGHFQGFHQNERLKLEAKLPNLSL